MTEHKFTDDEIIRALERCTTIIGSEACEDCPMQGKCREDCDILEKSALDLINRQKAEIEDLEIKNEHLVCFLAEARKDAFKEFTEGLKEKLYGFPTVYNSAFSRMIDNFVKEMTEGV